MDIAAIGSALSSVKSAIDLAKIVRDAAKSLENAEVNMKLADLMNALADANVDLADVKQALVDKDSRISDLEAQLKVRASLQWRPPFYWGEGDDGPYCPKCLDGEGKRARLLRLQDADGYRRCTVCSGTYYEHGG